MKLIQSESDLKRAVEDYLTFKMNSGKLWFARLNSGDFFVSDPAGLFRRRIKGCAAGTADFLVILNGQSIFIELKSLKGKQKDNQKEFEVIVKSVGAKYLLVRDVEEVIKVVEG